MQTDAEVAAIAAGLTALRAKTLRSITAKANPIDRCGYQLANNRPAQWLVRAGLLDDFDNSCGGDRHDGRYVEWRYALTPLGLRVAQHLKQENAKCRIGSCQRHGKCMYAPCRIVAQENAK